VRWVRASVNGITFAMRQLYRIVLNLGGLSFRQANQIPLCPRKNYGSVGRSFRHANRSISVVGPRIALDQTGWLKEDFCLGVSLAVD
jgi:hypothetical protein